MDNFGLNNVQWSNVASVDVKAWKPYDAEVECIESTGTQYIDTGIKTGPGYWSIKFAITAAKFGEATRIAGGNRNNSASRFYIWHNANETSVGATNVGTAVVHYSLDSSNCVEIGKTQQTQASSDNNIWVFAAQGFSEYSAIRLYYFKLWDSTGNTLLRDFIPVRKNGIGYLYDKVSHQLFGNQGTGEFLYGGDIVPIEYITTDMHSPYGDNAGGAAYIDTGLTWGDLGPKDFVVETWNDQRLNWGIISPGVVGVAWIGRSGDNVMFGNYDNQGSNVAATTRGHAIFDVIDGFTFNGEKLYTPTSTWNAPPNNSHVVLFVTKDRNDTLRQYWYIGSIGRIVIKRRSTGVVLRDFQAVRIGTEGCLLDKVNWKIYRNNGTGSFVRGIDIDDHTVIKLEKGIGPKELVWMAASNQSA